MTSIYQLALGSNFNRLHPRIQQRFGLCSADRVASIGEGVMEELWRGRPYTVPFLYIGAWRRIMFPDHGKDIPFRVENYAYVDGFGRETVTWVRTFEINGRPRRFDAYMIFSQERRKIVDYLGTHQHLAVDIDLSVDERGGLRLLSGEQRFYEHWVGFRFPMVFSGIADVREWYDDKEARFHIDVSVTNRRWGRLFGYRGWFHERRLSSEEVPERVKPRREELRE
jgi:hypothetical protein